MSISKARRKEEQLTWQEFVNKNNDNQTMMLLVMVVFNKGIILFGTNNSWTMHRMVRDFIRKLDP
jgi:hypothetical protein